MLSRVSDFSGSFDSLFFVKVDLSLSVSSSQFFNNLKLFIEIQPGYIPWQIVCFEQEI